jgi:hypothetical protein
MPLTFELGWQRQEGPGRASPRATKNADSPASLR